MGTKDEKIGRNDPCPCGDIKPDGTPKKYKNCCLDKDRKKSAEPKRARPSFSRKDLISGPYKQCPKCLTADSFGVMMMTSGSQNYSRECIKCWHQKGYKLPQVKKKILYLDQFVISNLVKLLDKDHKSHAKIKADPFWESLFIKLEAAIRSQAIVCPDSSYHRDESLVGDVNFKLMKRLYEHFSGGKTLHESYLIEQMQIYEHFENWLEGKKTDFSYGQKSISSEDLDTWSGGIQVSVNMRPFLGEIDKLRASNASTKEQLQSIWTSWQSEKDFSYVNKVREETLGLGKGLLAQFDIFHKKRNAIMANLAADPTYKFELDDIMPPPSNNILETLYKKVQRHGISEENIAQKILEYFNDTESLLEIPKIKTSSVMFASLARKANLGQKRVPKSFVDVGFISSYFPYCDAMFVDIESAIILREPPVEIPAKLKLKEFPAKIFSLNKRQALLDYLDESVANVPEEQIAILKDIHGDDYAKPFWQIIEHEKQEKD